MAYSADTYQANKPAHRARTERWRLSNLDKVNAGARARRARMDPEQRRAMYRRDNLRRWGITPEQYDAMLAAQDGGCAICAEPPGTENLHIDHDHACCPGQRSCGKCLRGLLCSNCNTALGLFCDDTALLRAAQRYLREAVA
jgi:hypothetical protein